MSPSSRCSIHPLGFPSTLLIHSQGSKASVRAAVACGEEREAIAMHGSAHFIRLMKEVGRAPDACCLKGHACCKLEHLFRLPSSSFTPPVAPLIFALNSVIICYARWRERPPCNANSVVSGCCESLFLPLALPPKTKPHSSPW